MIHTHYIRAGGRLVAIYKSGTGGLNTLRYVHTDHLGSITELTNETGGLVESLSYDPWGKRRNADWSDAAGQLYATHTKRSFTGHEYLEDASLIHMNGRVYDPDTGRMLSPDPFINQPANPQSYNRYSYVLNNPLSYTDPSGHEIEEITINGTRIHIRPLDLKTGLGAASLFSNSSSSYPVVSSSFFVVQKEVEYTPTGSHIPRKTTVPALITLTLTKGQVNPFSRIPRTGINLAVHGSVALVYARGTRQLTKNEINAALSVFPDLKVNLIMVIYDRSGSHEYADDYTLHFPKSMDGCQDFITSCSGSYAGLFIHAITHAWQYQHREDENRLGPFWGHILSQDLLRFGDYLPKEIYLETPTPVGLNTEQEADWYKWNYICTNGLETC